MAMSEIEEGCRPSRVCSWHRVLESIREHGRVNMELGAPQAEYRELNKQWEDIVEHGKKDARRRAR